jgi:hypothetical protein
VKVHVAASTSEFGYTSIPTNPNQKNENFHEKIKCLE